MGRSVPKWSGYMFSMQAWVQSTALKKRKEKLLRFREFYSVRCFASGYTNSNFHKAYLKHLTSI